MLIETWNWIKPSNIRQYFMSIVIVMNFWIILMIHRNSISIRTTYALFHAEVQSDLNLSILFKQENRLKILNEKCDDSNFVPVENLTSENVPAYLIKHYPWLRTGIFPLQSRSLLYCAIPKVASKTLISFMVYLNLLDAFQHLNNKTLFERNINFDKLLEQLVKVLFSMFLIFQQMIRFLFDCMTTFPQEPYHHS